MFYLAHILLTFIIFNTFKQQVLYSCSIPEGILIGADELENNSFKLDRKLFSEELIKNVKTSVHLCKAHVEMKIENIKHQISQLIDKKSILEGSININDLIRRNQTLRNEKKRIIMSFHEDIKNHDMKGMFAVIIESSDPFTNLDTLIASGRHYMGTQAVKTIIGQLMQSKTWINNNDNLIRTITSVESSGIFKIDSTLINEPAQYFHNKTQFIYSAIIKVTPLKQKKYIQLNNYAKEVENCCVVNLLDDNWQQEFCRILTERTDLDYAERMKKNITAQSKQWESYIVEYNKQSLLGIEQKHNQLKRHLELKNNEILRTSMEITKVRSLLDKIYSKMGISKSDNPEKQLKRAIAQTNQEIHLLYNQIKIQLSKKMEIRNESLQTTRDPLQELRQKVLSIYHLMKETYSKQETIFEKNVIKNAILTQAEQKHLICMVRIPKQIYIFPYTNLGKINILIVMKFSMLNLEKQNIIAKNNITDNKTDKLFLGKQLKDKESVKNRKSKIIKLTDSEQNENFFVTLKKIFENKESSNKQKSQKIKELLVADYFDYYKKIESTTKQQVLDNLIGPNGDILILKEDTVNLERHSVISFTIDYDGNGKKGGYYNALVTIHRGGLGKEGEILVKVYCYGASIDFAETEYYVKNCKNPSLKEEAKKWLRKGQGSKGGIFSRRHGTVTPGIYNDVAKNLIRVRKNNYAYRDLEKALNSWW